MPTGEIVQAFTEDQTARLTGASVGQLRSWDRTNFYRPSISVVQGRVYTFRDLLNLRVIITLRRDLGISLQHLREVGPKLRELADADWSDVRLFVHKRRVVFENPRTTQREEVLSGQGLLGIPLRDVKAQMRDAVAHEFARRDNAAGKIEKVRRVVGSEPVIAGTRIKVDSVMAFLDDGYDDAAILAEYPSLTKADIAAVRARKTAA
ncbi:MAG: DUF433 domain-containing protein [Rubellimicrobium sp.]|nr:DUF433 domain-containing protein [Rubellimicrobium sp.]